MGGLKTTFGVSTGCIPARCRFRSQPNWTTDKTFGLCGAASPHPATNRGIAFRP